MTSGSMPVDQEDQADMLGNNELVAEFAACVRFFMHTLHAAVSHVDHCCLLLSSSHEYQYSSANFFAPVFVEPLIRLDGWISLWGDLSRQDWKYSCH